MIGAVFGRSPPLRAGLQSQALGPGSHAEWDRCCGNVVCFSI